MSDLIDKMWPRGKYPCRGGCGATVERSFNTCPACDERIRREEAEARQRAVAACLLRSADTVVPPRFRGLDLDGDMVKRIITPARVKKARKALASLAARECTTLVLSGPAAAGKTVTACALLRAWILDGGCYGDGTRPYENDDPSDVRARQSGMYTTAIDLANARRDGGLGETPEIIVRAIRAQLLVIDDIGQETMSEPCRASLREVVWARYDRARPTVYTTAQSQEWVKQAHGDGFARRMFEDAIEITWPWGSK